MRMRSKLFRWFSVFLLLYVQGVIAYAACVSASAAPADAFGNMPEDCPRQYEANLCLANCQQSDQSGAHAQVPLLPVLDMVTLRLPPLALAGATPPMFDRACTRHVHPPPRVLLCSLNL